MINFYTLYSGSSGNASLVSTDNTNILIDVGVSCAKVTAAIREVGVSPEEIDAILITHEHSDHIHGVEVFTKKYNIPIYANRETLDAMGGCLKCIFPDRIREIKPYECFEIRDAKVFPFEISHDASHPMGYSIMSDGQKVSFVTDMGKINETVLKIICKSDAVLIESNHDENMLINGIYPWSLKKRILSDKGHLSNDKAAWLATQLAKWGTRHIALGHLSDKNNTPEKAYDTTYNMLKNNSLHLDVNLSVAPRSGVLKII